MPIRELNAGSKYLVEPRIFQDENQNGKNFYFIYFFFGNMLLGLSLVERIWNYLEWSLHLSEHIRQLAQRISLILRPNYFPFELGPK